MNNELIRTGTNSELNITIRRADNNRCSLSVSKSQTAALSVRLGGHINTQAYVSMRHGALLNAGVRQKSYFVFCHIM
ncbi:Uncharacterised protein [uncultured archaeon]|nr:Uncharacterised protein [uncultured archaeon]